MKRLPLLAALALPAMVQAQSGQPQVLTYAPDQVVPLSVAPGYATLVELGPDERVENVVVGDSGAWQVTPTKRGDRFVVKPIGSGATTDLVVTTTSRRYIFLLRTGSGNEPFVLRFDYPEAAPPAVAAPEVLVRYRLKGDKSLFPATMTDDGRQTSIAWKPGTPLPAVFAVDAQGNEALVNGRMVGETYVVEGTAPRYAFRRDKQSAVAIRQTPKAR